MTNDETLDWLYRLKSEIYVYMPRPWLIPMGNALDMAIKALEQEPKQMVEIDLYSVIKQKYIEREVLDKIRAEIIDMPDADLFNLLTSQESMDYKRGRIRVEDIFENFKQRTRSEILKVIDKYKTESEAQE